MPSRASRNNNSRQNGSGQSSPWSGEPTRAAAASSSSSAEAVLEFKVQPPATVIRNRRPRYAVGEVRYGSASGKILRDVGVGCYIFPNVRLDAPVEAWYYFRASFRVTTGDGSTEIYSVSSGSFLLAPGEPHDPDEREFYRRVDNAGLLG
ncbi:hypothetical protein DL771_009055 [Monosporascus sp. 5C6A]|nr:hypothetical protein DL771_009055 [Monosporascus sp. 5C6A]